MSAVRIGVRRLVHGRDMPLPAYETEWAAGMDLRAAIDSEVSIAPGQHALIATGLVIALPEGHEAQIRPRSGLALKHGIMVVNSPGTVDADYRGEVSVLLLNTGDKIFSIARGMRIAQMVIAPVTRCEWVEGELDQTARGAGGYGSTGTGAG